MTKHNVFTFILDLHMSIVCSCALCRTNIFSANYLAFTLDRFEVSADALDGLIHIAAFLALLTIALFTILIDCIHCKVKIPPSVAIGFNVLTGKPHAVFRTFLTDAWNFWQKLNRRYAKWVILPSCVELTSHPWLMHSAKSADCRVYRVPTAQHCH